MTTYAAWHNGNLVTGEAGDYWNDASTGLWGGDTADKLAAEYAAAGRLVQLDGEGFFPYPNRFLTDLRWEDFAAEYPDLARKCSEEAPSAVGKPLVVSIASPDTPARYRNLITLTPGSRDGFPVMQV